MEHQHEDNEYLENYMQNSQNLLENLQFNNQAGEGVVAFDAMGDRDRSDGCVVDSAGKYEEHFEHPEDNEEWKYIKEKHQNEKQSQQHHHDILKGMGNGNGDGDGPDHNAGMLLDEELVHHVMGNGEAIAANANGNNNAGNIETGNLEEDLEVIKNDLSTTSNVTTSTTQSPVDDKDVVADIMEVEMKIEAAPHQSDFETNLVHGHDEELDEEEPSSLATNGSSSLSENQIQHNEQQQQQQQQQQHEHEQNELFDVQCESEKIAVDVDVDIDVAAAGVARPAELDFEHHSHLNPEAKEFVPSFSSNPASPTVAPVSVAFGNESPLSHEEHIPHPTAGDVARHIFGEQRFDDDFIAHSPHKERIVDMEAISVPAENDFDNEAAQRPHELEQVENLIGEVPNGKRALDNNFGGEDCQDFNRQSPASFIDHGPETSVDVENEFMSGMQPVEDVMKQSIYVENTQNAPEEPIEHLLNTVQQLPIDEESLNASFNNERELMVQMGAEKELLNFEEKEHVSHSPSTEEIQSNFTNDLHSDTHTQEIEPMKQDDEIETAEEKPFRAVEERSLLLDTTIPLDSNNASFTADTEASFEMVRNAPIGESGDITFEAHIDAAAVPPQNLEFCVNDAQDLMHNMNDNNISPSPHSTEEKHLVEETKETTQQLFGEENLSELGQKLDDMQLTHDDGNLANNPFEEVQHKPHFEELQQPLHDEHQQSYDEFHQQQEQQQFFEQTQNELEKLQQPQIPDIHQQTYEELSQQQFSDEHQQSYEQIHQQQEQQQLFDEHRSALETFEQQQQLPVEQHEEVFEKLEQPQQQPFEAFQQQQIPDEHQQQQFFKEHVEAELQAQHSAEVESAIVPQSEPVVKTENLIADVPESPKEEATGAATAAVVAAAAVATAAAVTTVGAVKKAATPAAKKPATKPTTGTAAAKPKVGIDAKKPLEAKKSATTTAKPAGTTAAARPRTAPAKTTASSTSVSSAEKKSLSSTSSASNAAKPAPIRKTFTARPAPKTTTTTAPRSASATAASAAKASTSTGATTATGRPSGVAARKSATTTAAPSSTKLRTTTTTATAPAKPTTLGIASAAKPKLSSPRSTLTTQLRKPLGGATTTAARSPTKTTSGTETITKSSATSIASRTKVTGTTSSTTTTTTTTTKRFVARPAPKTTASTTTTTTRRVTLSGATNGPTSVPSKTSTTAITKRLTSPSKGTSATKLTPTKSSTTSTLKSPRTKDAVAVSKTTKLAVVGDAVPKTNGTVEASQLNGGSNVENGLHLEEHHSAGNIAEPEVNLLDV